VAGATGGGRLLARGSPTQWRDRKPVTEGKTGSGAYSAEELRRIAREGLPVLVLSKSMTRCNAVAKEIHALSGVEGPFIRYTCRPLTPREGQLRSLSERCASLFDRADSGTLYFHQVDALSSQEQRQLYSVLESGRYWKPEANRMEPVHFRIVASSFPEILHSGLAPDLLYRLGARVIELRDSGE